MAETTTAELYGQSRAMLELRRDLEFIARTDAQVLVVGETGAGKELVARTLHGMSLRAGGPWVAVNCAAIPEGLVESEFFGHVRGAFTGAERDNPGRFREAQGGTLFLDEVGELSPLAQAKLLRVLADAEYQPVGGRGAIRADVRILSATNCDLRQLVAQQRFRADLYYRLRAVEVHVPPLRRRREDLPVLIDHFLERLGGEGTRQRLTPPALAAMLAWRYPGNVRELKQLVQHALALSHGGPIERRHLPAELLGHRKGDETPISSTVMPLREALEACERACLVRALEVHGGHRSATAEALSISRKTLWEKMRHHGLDPDAGEQARAERGRFGPKRPRPAPPAPPRRD